MIPYRKVFEITGWYHVKITGWCHEGATFCDAHKPSDEAYPIFLGTEFDCQPTCDVCNKTLEVTLI